MKAIVNGFPYNTKTSEKIGTNHNGLLPDDLRISVETLYRTKTGDYFIHGEGGAESKYGKKSSRGWIFGAAIIPLSHVEAFKWLSRTGFSEVAFELFPDFTGEMSNDLTEEK